MKYNNIEIKVSVKPDGNINNAIDEAIKLAFFTEEIDLNTGDFIIKMT
jgi:hypothetical protein